MWKRFWQWGTGEKPQPAQVEPKADGSGLRRAVDRFSEQPEQMRRFEVKPPEISPLVGPKDSKVKVAMDSALSFGGYGYAYEMGGFPGDGFAGYPYLAMLATRAEYRAFATAWSRELTRKWIQLNSSETASDQTKERIARLNELIEQVGLRRIIAHVSESDTLFGRGQILIDIGGHDLEVPLKISPKTIKKGSTVKLKFIEPIWTSPIDYNATDPLADDYYKPSAWFVYRQKIHSSRLLTVITRPLPDILKPAFNFSGISLSQLAEPYVNNWLNTRQSIADLLKKFSTTFLKTNMAQMLMGGSAEDAAANGTNLAARIMLFTATRGNQGVMALDKEGEDLGQINTPLSGLDALQAQALEHLCTVSGMPAVVLTGLSPTGLNVSTDGEMGAWRDRVSASQESDYREVVQTVVDILQIAEFGEIDKDIHFSWVPLFQMSAEQIANIRKLNADTATAYIGAGVIAPEEQREILARDPESGYQGLDLTREVESEDDENDSTLEGQ